MSRIEFTPISFEPEQKAIAFEPINFQAMESPKPIEFTPIQGALSPLTSAKRFFTDPTVALRAGKIFGGGLLKGGELAAASVPPMVRSVEAGLPTSGISERVIPRPIRAAERLTESITGAPSSLSETAIKGAAAIEKPLSEAGEAITPKKMSIGELMLYGIGTSAPAFIPAFASSKILAAAKMAPKIASAVGIGIDALQEAFIEAGGAYSDAVKAGKSPDIADQTARKVFLGNSLILPFTNKLQGLFEFGATAKRLLTGAAIGGGAEEVVQDVIQGKSTGKTMKEIAPQLPQTALVGVGAGLAMGSAVHYFNMIQEGRADEAIKSTKTPQEQQAVKIMVDDYNKRQPTFQPKPTDRPLEQLAKTEEALKPAVSIENGKISIDLTPHIQAEVKKAMEQAGVVKPATPAPSEQAQPIQETPKFEETAPIEAAPDLEDYFGLKGVMPFKESNRIPEPANDPVQQDLLEVEKKGLKDRYELWRQEGATAGFSPSQSHKYAIEKLAEETKRGKELPIAGESMKQRELATDGVESFGRGKKGEQELFAPKQEEKKPVFAPKPTTFGPGINSTRPLTTYKKDIADIKANLLSGTKNVTTGNIEGFDNGIGGSKDTILRAIDRFEQGITLTQAQERDLRQAIESKRNYDLQGALKVRKEPPFRRKEKPMSGPYEISNFVNRKGKLATGIIEYPTGKWGIVGGVPIELAVKKTNSLGQPYSDSKIFETKDEAHNALANLGYSTTDGVNYRQTGTSDDFLVNGEPRFREKKHPTETPEFQKWFSGSKVIGKDGKPQIVYHGSIRPDRIGNRFLKSRATSGPMAYFTDNPEIASGYATGKRDTSLDYEDTMYESWFKAKVKGRKINLDQYWYELPREEQQRLKDLLPRIEINDKETGEALEKPEILQNDTALTSKSHWDDVINRKNGNALSAAIDMWLSSGSLFDDELRFMDILNTAGIKNVEFDNPHAERSGVLPVYLNIRNPLDTSNITPDIVNTLERMAKYQGKPKEYGADHWDKNTQDAVNWVDTLKGDIKDNTTYAWTSVPNWVTKVLKSMGYDGIRDTGGKYNEVTHIVWIPFEPTQIKSATGNRGTFSSDSPDIRFRQSTDYRTRLKSEGINITSTEMEQLYKENERLFGDRNLRLVDKIMTRDGRQGLGQYWRGMIDIVQGEADKMDSFYHESWHKMKDMFATEEEKAAINEESRKRGWDEENEAENIIPYAKSRQGFIGRLKAILDSILERAKIFFGKGSPTRKLYADLMAGRARIQTPSPRWVPAPAYKKSPFKPQDPTQTEAFKKWFGKSKVVDENENPLIVYHGSLSDFNIFDIAKGGQANSVSKVGFWFSPMKHFADNFANSIWYGDGKKPITYSVYLSIKNPKIYESDSDSSVRQTEEEWHYPDAYQKFKTDIYKIEGKTARDANIGGLGMSLDNREETVRKYVENLKRQGYDGIILKNTSFDKDVAGSLNDQYVAFSPHQIKSATGNAGTFNSENPDIRYRIPRGTPDPYKDRNSTISQIRQIIASKVFTNSEVGKAMQSVTGQERPIFKDLTDEQLTALLDELKKTEPIVKKAENIKSTIEGRQVKSQVFKAAGLDENTVSLPESQALKNQVKAEARGAEFGYKEGKKEAEQMTKLEMLEKFRSGEQKVNDVITYIKNALPKEERSQYIEMAKAATTAGKQFKVIQSVEQRVYDLEWKRLAEDVQKLAKSSKMVAAEYTRRIYGLVEGLDFKNITEPKRRDLLSLLQYVRANQDNLHVPEQRLEELNRLAKKPAKELNNRELLELQEQIEILRERGALKLALKNRTNEYEYQKNLEKLLESTYTLDAAPGKDVDKDILKAAGSKMYLQVLHPFRVMKRLDGNKVGEHAKFVKNASAAENNSLFASHSRFSSMLDEVMKIKSDWTEKEQVELAIISAHEQGGEEQVETLLREHGLKTVPQKTDQYARVLDIMRDAVSGKNDEHFNKIAAIYEETHNEMLEKVQNYLPFKYKQSYGETMESALADMISPNRYRTAFTKKSMTYQRVEGVKRIPRTDIFAIAQEAIAEQEWYINMQPILLNAHQLFNSEEYKAKAGAIGYDYMKSYLDTIARRGWSAHATANPRLKQWRLNLNNAVLGFRVSSIAAQPFAIFEALAYLNAEHGSRMAAKVMKEFTKSWVTPGYAKKVIGGSKALKLRMGGELGMEETFMNATRRGKIRGFIEKMGMYPLKWADLRTAAGVQQGIENILRKQGVKNALEEAEYLMNVVSASTNVTLRPLILSRGEWARTVFTFQNFALNSWGILSEDVIRNGIVKGDMNKKFRSLISLSLMFMGYTLLDELRKKIYELTTGKELPSRSMFEKALMYIPAQFPILGDLVEAAITGRRAHLQVPLSNVIEQAAEGAGMVFRGSKKTPAETRIRGALKFGKSAAALAFGIPGTMQAFDMAQRLIPKEEKKKKPFNPFATRNTVFNRSAFQ